MNAYIESAPTDFSLIMSGRDHEKRNPNEKKPEIQVLEAFRNEEAMYFVEESLLKRTTLFFPNHVQEANIMVKNIFHLVAMRALMGDIMKNGNLGESFTNIHNKILSSNSWFPEAYDSYRKERARKDFALIEPYLKKSEENKVLDFGCGMGHLSAELSEQKYVVTPADVIDYTDDVSKKDKNLTFKKMSSATDVDFSGEHFDTIIIWQVLHHIDEEHLSPILSVLSKIGDRLIINEELYGSGDEVKGFSQSIRKQKEFAQYVAMDENDQRAILTIIDYVANIIFGLSIHKMNMPLGFKTVAQWKTILSNAGFDIEGIHSVGIRGEHKWHPDAQILFDAVSREYKS